YVDDFVDGIFFKEDAQTKAQAKILYHNAMVPYLVKYNSGSGSIFLIIGLAMIGVFALVFIIFIIKSRNSSAKSSGSYTYVGAYTSSDDPNLNSPTGLKNASADPYFSRGANQVTTPYQQNSARRDYCGSERPMPAMPDRQQPERKILRYDPYTGQPVYAAEKTPAPKPSAPEGDSMPAIDPKTTDQVDLSNGGISPEEKAKYNAPMPTNGRIPVINPESGRNMTDMFGTVIPVQKTEAPAQETKQPPAPEAPVNEVTPIHPQTREDNISSEYQVEQTEIAGRSSIELSSGTMSTVDPYTEQNVDLTNGGIELSDESDSPDTGNRRDIPRARQAVNAPASAQEPAHEPAPVPAPEPVHEPAPAPENKPEPEKKNDYNIFRSTNSSYGSYTSNYTGGSSYNIFKKDENKPSGSDPGFPNADKSLPPIDTSFPTAGESDIGGKDDFDF
ncbi:MAG: hypothetical protein J6X60_12220, partial [Ruminiclostridium sp.]|nr:hypothetical protein [Ruminiclostridium sp.]